MGWLAEYFEFRADSDQAILRAVKRLADEDKKFEEEAELKQAEQFAKINDKLDAQLAAIQENTVAIALANAKLDQILEHLAPPPPAVKMQLQFEGKEVGMPGTETDVQTIPCSALETDAAGNPVTLDPTKVTWAIDNPAIASLTQNADGSATFKALTVGTANVSCTDSSNGLTGTDTLTVTAGPANKLALQFGAAA